MTSRRGRSSSSRCGSSARRRRRVHGEAVSWRTRRCSTRASCPGAGTTSSRATWPELTDDVIDITVERSLQINSPMTSFPIWQMGGAVSRVGEDETPFGGRKAAFTYNIGCCTETADGFDDERQWVRDFWSALEPWHQTVYVNFLDDEGEDRIRAAYGPREVRPAEGVEAAVGSGQLLPDQPEHPARLAAREPRDVSERPHHPQSREERVDESGKKEHHHGDQDAYLRNAGTVDDRPPARPRASERRGRGVRARCAGSAIPAASPRSGHRPSWPTETRPLRAQR